MIMDQKLKDKFIENQVILEWRGKKYLAVVRGRYEKFPVVYPFADAYTHERLENFPGFEFSWEAIRRANEGHELNA